MDGAHQAPRLAPGELLMLGGGVFVKSPDGRQSFEAFGGRRSDRQNGRPEFRCCRRACSRVHHWNGKFHMRRLVREHLQPGVLKVEPVVLFGNRFPIEQTLNDAEPDIEAIANVIVSDTNHMRIVGQRTGTYAEHQSTAELMIELYDPARDQKRVVIWQRHDAGAEANVLGYLGSRRQNDFGATDNFGAARMMFADPEI